MTFLRLPITLSIIYGSFTLGLYIAIQGPTLMDLIDQLHVNNDIMSYSLAFASLAYSFGGLVSGFLFNYVNRQLLISAYFVFFGVASIATPFITNFLLYSVMNVFKMMCAGGTDCGANVWILEMWPGQDSWLQALHFSFAVGCAIGPLIVEPFLSVEYGDTETKIDQISDKNSGATTINDQSIETRIYIPYGISGFASILAAVFIIVLYWLQEKKRNQDKLLRLKQKAAAGESILMTSWQHPAPLEAGAAGLGASRCIPEEDQLELERERQQETEAMLSKADGASSTVTCKQAVFLSQQSSSEVTPRVAAVSTLDSGFAPSIVTVHQSPQHPPLQNQHQNQQRQLQVAVVPAGANAAAATGGSLAKTESSQQQPASQQEQQAVKITSKYRDERGGKPPYYVMFAIVLAALCLSFYCGIEITSMNWLTTFALNIEPIHLTKSTAALMCSALTISFAVGRGFGIWIAIYIKPHKLFYLCAAIMATGNVLMLCSIKIPMQHTETLLWCSICLFGLGCGPMFPAIVSFYDEKISKVTNTVSGIFILGSMFNVALNSLIIGHHIIGYAQILIICNLVGSVLLLLLFGTLHMLTRVKKNQRVRKFQLQQVSGGNTNNTSNNVNSTGVVVGGAVAATAANSNCTNIYSTGSSIMEAARLPPSSPLLSGEP